MVPADVDEQGRSICYGKTKPAEADHSCQLVKFWFSGKLGLDF